MLSSVILQSNEYFVGNTPAIDEFTTKYKTQERYNNNCDVVCCSITTDTTRTSTTDRKGNMVHEHSTTFLYSCSYPLIVTLLYSGTKVCKLPIL